MHMAIPMRASPMRSVRHEFFTRICIIGLFSCSAAQDGQKSTVENAPEPHPTSAVATAVIATSGALAKPPAGPQDIVAWACGEQHEHHLEDPRPRALSQHVVDGSCREDSECGDGFCDRGLCAPIWEERYGQRCTANCQCDSFVCLDGRCRSCMHHAECVDKGGACAGHGLTTVFSYACCALGPHETHLPREPVRPPPPSMPSPSP
jgi:hypothetical protein